MILIIGGAYQGKLDHAKAAYQLSEDEIFTCGGTDVDFSRRCLYRLEAFTHACTETGQGSVAFFEAHRSQWQNSILICQDLSGGVVPMDARDRAWRQETGRLCQYLAKNAEQVSRIFCGLEQRLK